MAESAYLDLMKAGVLTVFFLIFAAAGFAQEPAYLHFGVGEGLPSTLVYCAIQDQKGFLWFGTDKGLARFDGTRFKVFGMKDGLPDLEVVGIFEDSQGRLWLSCFGQAPSYLKDGKFVTAAENGSLSKLRPSGNYTIFEDSQKRLWFCSGEDMFYCLDHDVVREYKAENSILKVGEFNGEMYAFGFWFIYKVTQSKLTDPFFTIPPPFCELSFNTITTLKSGLRNGSPANNHFFSKLRFVSMAQNGNRLLYLYREGLLLLEFRDGHFVEMDRDLDVLTGSVFSGAAGGFWVRKSDAGALLYPSAPNLEEHRLYVPNKKVSFVFEDREKNTWFTTLNEGVLMLPVNAALTYRPGEKTELGSDNFTAICQLTNGQLVLGDDAGHLFFKTGNNWEMTTIPEYKGYNKIRQIMPLPENGWMALSDRAIFQSNGRKLIPNYAVGSYKAMSITPTATWVGTSNYFLKWENGRPFSKIHIANRTMMVETDHSDNVWISKLTGLYSQKDSFQTDWATKFPVLSSRILDLKRGKANLIWATTPELGLLKITVQAAEVKSVEVINDQIKTPIDNIKSVFPAADGRVWLATNRGVYSLSPDGSVMHYDQANGLVNNDVNAVLVDHDTLWAATVSGLSKLLLRQQDESGEFPTMIVGIRYTVEKTKTPVDLTNIPAHTEKSVLIPAKASMLEIELAQIRYRTRGNFRYEYTTEEQLLPLHLITFRNLISTVASKFGRQDSPEIIEGPNRYFGLQIPPGNYHSTVTAILPNGTRSTMPDTIEVTVLPYWWQTIWVHLGLAALAGFGIWHLFKGRERFLKIQHANAELQLQAIRSQMNPHFVGNSINAIQQFFFPPDPVRASEYIATFSDLLRRTMAFSEADFIQFSEELRYVQDYLEMVKLRFGEHFSYEIVGADSIEPTLPMPAMLLQPILENATIHGLSPDGHSELKIVFVQKPNLFTCTITDNGIGIGESKLRKASQHQRRPSKGLELLHHKTQIINNLYQLNLKVEILDLTTQATKMQGTKVTFSFHPKAVLRPNAGSKT